MTLPLADVLWIGGTDRSEIADLRASGHVVEQSPSLLAAIESLRARPRGLVVVESEELSGRERERFAALRDEGAGALLALYPPSEAWRTDRALASGADLALALPAAPGLLDAVIRRLAAPDPRASGAAAVGSDEAPRAEPPQGTSDVTPTDRVLSEIVGDVAVLHRHTNDLDRVLDLLVQSAARISGALRVSVLLFDRTRSALRVARTTAGFNLAEATAVTPGQGLAGVCALRSETRVVPDISREPTDPAAPFHPERGYATPSCMLLPLRASAGVVGVLCLADRRDGACFDSRDVPRLDLFAGQAAQALENAVEFRHLGTLAAVDGLTGLTNRRQFDAALEREVQRARRYARPFTLAIFDLDHFKTFNDRCGHQAGDRALAAMGEILRTSLREADVVARYGGEEFAVILPETSPQDTGAERSPFPFLERLRRRVEETHFAGAEKLPGGRLTVSGGVASFPDDATTAETILRAADLALYESKARGRNTITYRGRDLAQAFLESPPNGGPPRAS